MDDRKLKEYALKIFNNVSGYSLQKAFTLFPMYYPKIAFYYSELITKKQEELTTRTIQQVGITRANTLVKLSRETNIAIEKYYAYSLANIYSWDYESTENIKTKAKELFLEIKNISELNNNSFNSTIEEANKYGYANILKEAKYYLIKNEALLADIAKTSVGYIENLYYNNYGE